MVVGGFLFVEDETGTAKIAKTSASELVDLVHPEPLCKSPPDVPGYPHGIAEGQMAYFQSKVLYCSTGCHSLEPLAEEWTQFVAGNAFYRRSAASSLIGDVWLISGGYNNKNVIQASSDYWDGSQFHSGPVIPEPMAYHCQVTISETKVFFSRICYTTDFDIGPTFMLDWINKGWETLASQPDTKRFKRFGDCGKYLTPEGKVEIVSVGDGISDIYNVENNEWREGPKYAPFISQVTTVQFEGTFWVLGGMYVGQEASDVFMVYESDAVGFKVLPQKLAVARSRISTVIVPRDFCQQP